MSDLTHVASGKVREIYDAGDDRLLMVTSDRLSAFDVVLPTAIPDKGRVLTGLSVHWFSLTEHIIPNHLISTRLADLPQSAQAAENAGRTMLVKKLEMLPIECIVRGYLVGSGWKDYCATSKVCGIQLPPGMQEAGRLPEPLFTPSSKAVTGHDENITPQQAIDAIGAERYAEAERAALALYSFASDYARERGIILADTKFEMGLDSDGVLHVADEVLTPDSSRFWPADSYAPGSSPPSFDKQFVRDFLETTDWDKTDPGPALPDTVRDGTAARYRDAYERISGRSFDDYLREASA